MSRSDRFFKPSGATARTRALLATPLLLAGLAAPLHADSLFLEPLSLGMGNNPHAVATGDLNGDGRADLVVANYGSNTVSVLLGQGGGAFAARTDFLTGGAPSSLAIADLNGDNRPDLVLTNAVSNTVSVLLGNGNGTFATRTDFGTGICPSWVAIADLNADGHPDLAVSNLGSNTVSVLLGIGDGTFADKRDFGTGTSPRALGIADFNRDGRPDLAVANQFALPLSVLLGNGDGTFAERKDYLFNTLNPSALAVADLNGDGRPDLAVPSGGLDEVSLLFGNGDGTFAATLDVATGLSPTALAIADFNADGRPDMVTSNAGSNSVSILLQNAGGAFDAEPDLITEEYPFSVAAADLDGDGRPDVAAANNLSNSLSIFLTLSTPIAMALHLEPRNFNEASRHRQVTGFLEPASPYAASDIEITSIRLNDTVPVDLAAPTSIGDQDRDGIPDLSVHFDAAALLQTLPEGDAVAVTVTGRVAGRRFSGTDHLRVHRLGAFDVGWRNPSAWSFGPGGRGSEQLALAIRAMWANPTRGGRLHVDFALRDASTARLDLVDVAGRTLLSREVGSMGLGVHSLEIAADAPLPPGIYFLRLAQGTNEVRARVTVVR